MKNNLSKIITGALIFTAIILAVAYTQTNNKNTNPKSNINETSDETSDLSITAKIDNGETQVSYDKQVSSGTTALELMNLISEEDGIVLGTTEYDFGTLIDSIDGMGEDTADGKYWSFYVNDEMSDVGMADYSLNNNDTITMKYQAL